MTYQTSSAENKVGFSFFSGEMKRSWSNFILYFVVNLFTLTIPVIMFFQNRDMAFIHKEDVASYLLNVAVSSTFIALVCAVFAGCVATKYLNSKVSAYFYHSIPVKRETLYFSKISIGIINYVSTFILNILLSFVIIASKFGMSELIFQNIALLVMYTLLMFLFSYFLTVCVGMICGSTGFQFVLTGVAMFIVPAMFAAIMLVADRYYTYTNTNWYLGNLQYMSPIFRIFEAVSTEFSLHWWEALVILALSVIFAWLALLIYRKRGNENAENPLAFPRLISVVKYIIMIPATLYMGLILYAVSGTESWLFIGFFLGAAISFMLLNTILRKNAREMFKGIKGFAIYCVIFTVLFVSFALDIAQIDKYIPSENAISYINISLHGRDYGDYSDDNVIKILSSDLKHYMDIDSRNGYQYTNDYYYAGRHYSDTASDVEIYPETEMSEPKAYEAQENKDSDWAAPENPPEYYENNNYIDITSSDKVDMEIVFYTKSGIPVAKTYHISTKEFITDTLRAIADSDEFEEYFLSFMKIDDYFIGMNVDISHIKENGDEKNKETAEKFFDIYKKDMGNVGYENFQKTQIGYGYFTYNGRKYGFYNGYLPIFIDFDNTIKEFAYYDGNDITDFYLKLIDSATVFKTNSDGKVDYKSARTVTDEENLKKIISTISFIGYFYYDNQIFTAYDYDYAVVFNYNKNYAENVEEYSYKYNNSAAYFLYGKTPDFVKSLFN